MPNRVAASIWLRLRPSQEQTLQAVIARLAERHGTPSFLPHLTVCGSTLDPTTREAASRYARTSDLLPLRVAASGVSCAVGNPFQAVFVEIVNSPELLRFREDLRRITRAEPFGIPHISLFYAVRAPEGSTLSRRHAAIAVDARDLEEMARECRGEIGDVEYVLERPAIAYAGAGGSWLRVPEWRVEDL